MVPGHVMSTVRIAQPGEAGSRYTAARHLEDIRPHTPTSDDRELGMGKARVPRARHEARGQGLLVLPH